MEAVVLQLAAEAAAEIADAHLGRLLEVVLRHAPSTVGERSQQVHHGRIQVGRSVLVRCRVSC